MYFPANSSCVKAAITSNNGSSNTTPGRLSRSALNNTTKPPFQGPSSLVERAAIANHRYARGRLSRGSCRDAPVPPSGHSGQLHVEGTSTLRCSCLDMSIGKGYARSSGIHEGKGDAHARSPDYE